MTARPICIESEIAGRHLLLWAIDRSPEAGIVEGGTYKYRIDGVDSPVLIEPSELFEPDPDDSRTGRFRPRNHVGTVVVVVISPSGEVAQFQVDVRPDKFKDEAQYRTMLEQIADRAAEALLQGFSPATTTVNVQPTATGELNYRALAFLVARLRDESFQSSIERILRTPHRRWIVASDRRHIGRGLPPSSTAARQLTKSGRRVDTPRHLGHMPTLALPISIEWNHNIVTYDTPPNRFVRYAFESWRALAEDVIFAFRNTDALGAGPRRRGLAEAQWLQQRCTEFLSSPPLLEASALTALPMGDPVLLRQAGYRDVLRVFALAQASIALDAVFPDDAFSATQRNVATLYEYWCFLVLMQCVESVVGSRSDAVVFEPSLSGMSLVLRQGAEHRHRWMFELQGRRLRIDLWFNRNFRRSADAGNSASTWASAMRPDVSMRIRPESARPSMLDEVDLDIWLHFDAKYRVQREDVEFTDDPSLAATRSDLLKMHSYRDAIRRSAGAYVLYPGDGDPMHHEEFHELLPGIGAFPLRPGSDGRVIGVEVLQQFLRDVMAHCANQASSAERSQYWMARYTRRPGRRVRPSSLLQLPPADETVILGYVRREQWAWVRSSRRYNLRADDRAGAVRITDEMLGARLIVLWSGDYAAPEYLGLFERIGPWQVSSAAELGDSGYPVRESLAQYLVAELNPVRAEMESAFASTRLSEFLSADYWPVATTWEMMATI